MKQVQVFCFAYAGGSSSFFSIFNNRFDPALEFVPIEIPGHGYRMDEKCLTDLVGIAKDGFEQIVEQKKDVPYILLGYSMGTDLSYEIAYMMHEKYGQWPLHMFLFGNTPPWDCDGEDIYDESWSDEEFVEKVLKIGGMKEEVLELPEFYDFFVPILRADFSAEQNYEMTRYDNKIKTTATVFYSKKDDENGLMKQWADAFDGKVTFHLMPGNHFFIFDTVDDVVRLMKTDLSRNTAIN